MRKRVRVSIAIGMAILSFATKAFADTDTAQTVLKVEPTLLTDRAVPVNVEPSIYRAKFDRPKPYMDRCHTQQDLTKSDSPCEYGNLDSDKTIVLFGDSHALSWFPAMERLAVAKQWRLISLTMSSCWPADIPAWNSTTNKLMPNCSLWRSQSLKDIVALKPYMVFVTGTRGFSTASSKNTVLAGDARTAVWESGMIRTINTLKKASSHVYFISDSPISLVDAPDCLKQHLKSIAACSTPYKKAVSMAWLSEEQKVANIESINWVNPTSWICSTDPCSPLSGRYEIFVDKGHLTASFAWTLEKPLWAYITTNNLT